MEQQTYRIELSADQAEAEQFREWLNAQGHEAKIGRSTGNYVNGAWTSSDADASETFNGLWSAYCNS